MNHDLSERRSETLSLRPPNMVGAVVIASWAADRAFCAAG